MKTLKKTAHPKHVNGRSWGLGFTALHTALIASFTASFNAHGHGLHEAPTLGEVSVEDSAQATHTHGGLTASQGLILPKRIADQNPARSADVLEIVPGLNVTQHSGGGKANQYFLRGFSLDHGTDLSTEFLGVPLNLPGHAHGQGYTDANMVIPELISRIEYRKGPYFAQDGDFSSAGALNIDYLDQLKKGLASLTVGNYGFRRALLANSSTLKDDTATLLWAIERTDNDGPWAVPEALSKDNVVLQYQERPTAKLQFKVALSLYESRWTSTDHIPAEAVGTTQTSTPGRTFGRFDSLDPSAGGQTQRYAVSGQINWLDDNSITQVRGYAVDYQLNLFSDFTYGLRDNSVYSRPGVLSDQFNQSDKRRIFGLTAEHTVFNNLGFVDNSQLNVGLGLRRDDAKPVGLYDTIGRERLGVRSEDEFEQTNSFAFLTQVLSLRPWLTTSLGVRHERFRVNLQGQFDDDNDTTTPNVARQGRAAAEALLPKFTTQLGPFANPLGATSVFVAYGRGLHSNDPRGLFTNTPLNYLAKSTGAELGLSHQGLVPGLSLTVTAFSLKSGSELVFVGDEGSTEAKAASRRHGLEWLANYQGAKGLQVDAFFTTVDAKFVDSANDGIPNAIKSSAGLAISQKLGNYQMGYRLRYLGQAPLNEERSIQSNSVVNSDVFLTYTPNQQWSVTASIYNLFDRDNSDIEYAQDYFLNGSQRTGKTFHAAVPRQLRLSAVYRF